MKSKSFTLLIAIIMAGLSVSAQNSRGRSYDAPYVSDASITIDGVADESFWSAIEYTEVDTIVSGEDAWDGSSDLTGKFKVFWDDDYLYVFVSAIDDVIEQGTNHDCDNVEWFFNVDSAQHARDGYNNLTASQLRMNVGDTENLLTGGGFATSAGDDTGFEYATNETDDGWELEGKIPWGLIYDADAQTTAHFDEIAIGTMIEFDINIGDGDGEGRETILTWNAKNTSGWKDVDLFGYLNLVEEINTSGIDPEKSRGRSYDAPMVSDASLTVDGVADELFWSLIDYTEVDTIVSGEDNWDGSDDLTGNFKLFWDADFLYLFVSAIDDVIEQGTDYNSDNVELFFNVDETKHERDGYKDLTASQVRLNVMDTENLLTGGGFAASAGDATGFEYATNETDDGWDLEAKIPWGLIYDADVQTTAHFDDIAIGTMVEFDINIGDGDGEGRETILTWNAKGTDGWKNVDAFGFLNLVDEIETSIRNVISSDISVYPTIVETKLNISVSNAAEFKSISLINIVGQTIKKVSKVYPDNTFSVGDLPSGIYIVKLDGVNNTAKSYKIIKK